MYSLLWSQYVAHLQNQGVQRHSVDFRHRVGGEGVVVGLGVEAVAHTRARATSTALSLLRTGSTYPELLKTLHLGLGVETHLLHLACAKKPTDNNFI